MLIRHNDKVAIAVQSWHAGDDKIFYILVPYLDKAGNGFVQAQCVAENDMQPLEPRLTTWQELADGTEGYPEAAVVAKQLYYVFDDGASRHPRYAEEIYEAFQAMITAYKEPAQTYLQKAYQETYDHQLAEARLRGWDTAAIEKREAAFPYLASEYRSL